MKLIALDPEDLAVVAAHLQDAAGTVGDMAYLPGDRRFVAIVNRFAWSKVIEGDKHTQPERRQAALRIEQVRAVKSQGIDLKAKLSVVSHLTAIFEPDPDPSLAPAGFITLVLAGEAAIRLSVDCVEVAFEDLGPVWAADGTPHHPVD